MSLRDTLDDAADLAIEGRRIDPLAVLAKAAERDAPAARLRRRAPWLLGVAAAAAVLVLTVALLPWPAFGRVAPAAPPPLGPTGLPTRLDSPPPWTPLVTEQPIEAASVLFAGEVVHGMSSTGQGLFVLSADGRQYRRLPWTGDVTGSWPALSADGRWVAWLDGNGGRSGSRPVVHVLRLRDGLHHDLAIDGVPGSVDLQVGTVVFLPRAAGLLVSASLQDPVSGNLTGRTWRADLTSSPTRFRAVCDCQEQFGVAADGTVYQGDATRRVAGLADLPALPDAPGAVVPLLGKPVAVSPDGSAFAQGNGDQILQVVRASGETTVGQPSLSAPDVLGWGARGLLVRWQVAGGRQPAGGRLVWVDPERGTGTATAELGAWTAERRPVVAAGLVATGTQVPTARPEGVPWWSGDHRSYLAARGVLVVIGLLGVGAILGFPWILRRLRRRDQDVLTTANGAAGNQGRLW